MTKFKVITKEKERVKVRQKESQVGQHGVLVQEVPGKVEEEEKVKVVEKEKEKVKERKAKERQKVRKEAREVTKVVAKATGADFAGSLDTGATNARTG